MEKAVEKTVEKENVILKESWNVNDLNLDANNEAIIESINGVIMLSKIYFDTV